MKKSLKIAKLAGLLGLVVMFFIAGCGGGGGKSLDNVTAPTDNNASLTYSDAALVEYKTTQIAVSDSTFNKTFSGGANIVTSGATYVGDAACVTCHQDTYNQFSSTPVSAMNHFDAAKRKVINGTFTATSGSCLTCHTVNGPEVPDWSAGGATPVRTLANGAFGLTAFDYKTNATTLLQVSTFATATLGGIQCENCHGPASLHVAGGGDVNFIVTGAQAVAVSTCDMCHDSPTHHSKSQSWRMSGVVDPTSGVKSGGHANSIETGIKCSTCHTAEGFIAFVQRKVANSAVYTFDSKGGVTATTGLHNINCSACHDPHQPSTASQLRIDAADLCITCHKAGSSGGAAGPGVISTRTPPYNEPHHNIQGRILAGELGMTTDDKMYIVSSTDPILTATYTPAIKQLNPSSAGFGPTMGSTTCVDCHMYVDPTVDRSHSFAPNSKACATCHANIDGAVIIGQKQAAYRTKIGIRDDGSTITGGVLDRLTKATAAFQAANPKGSNLTAAQKVQYADAKWNINLVQNDGSKGVHNSKYILQLIDNASALLTAIGF